MRRPSGTASQRYCSVIAGTLMGSVEEVCLAEGLDDDVEGVGELPLRWSGVYFFWSKRTLTRRMLPVISRVRPAVSTTRSRGQPRIMPTWPISSSPSTNLCGVSLLPCESNEMITFWPGTSLFCSLSEPLWNSQKSSLSIVTQMTATSPCALSCNKRGMSNNQLIFKSLFQV